MTNVDVKEVLEEFCKVHESLPKDSYEDYVLWFCLQNELNCQHPVELMLHPEFMHIDEYRAYVETYGTCLNVIENLLAPLSGSCNSLGAEKQHGKGTPDGKTWIH